MGRHKGNVNANWQEHASATSSASEMTYIVSGGALNSTHLLQ